MIAGPSEQFKIRGGIHLGGEVAIAGSKNCVLPAIAASLLTEEEVRLTNVPDIADVRVMADIARALGAEIAWDRARGELSLRARELSRTSLDHELSPLLRASILFSGALLGRTRNASFPYPGGDKIGARPITVHLEAFRALGIEVREEEMIVCDGARLAGGEVVLEEPSVTATENTILAAVSAPGKTSIRLAACEPHVQELVNLLNAMGGNIRWSGPGALDIEGVEKLHGAQFRINPDDIEISSFAALAAATRSAIILRGVELKYLDAMLLQLRRMGVEYRSSAHDLSIEKPRRGYHGFRIQSGLYPKLMSDYLPPFSVLATQAEGESLIHEWMYDGRLRYIEELRKMGANASILDPHQAVIIGPTALAGTTISSLDIRSGMTLLIAALAAEGETVICDIHHIDRGYARIEERLRALGADIERIGAK